MSFRHHFVDNSRWTFPNCLTILGWWNCPVNIWPICFTEFVECFCCFWTPHSFSGRICCGSVTKPLPRLRDKFVARSQHVEGQCWPNKLRLAGKKTVFNMYICNYMYILDYTRLIDTHRLVFSGPVWPMFDHILEHDQHVDKNGEAAGPVDLWIQGEATPRATAPGSLWHAPATSIDLFW